MILTLGFKKNIVFQLNKVRIFQKALKYLNLNNTNFIYDSVILLLSISGFIFWAAAVFFVCYQLDMGLSIFNILIIAALVEIIRFAPLTFQGIGIREPSFAYFASEFFGSSFDLAFLAGLIIYLYLSIINLFLGFCFYTFKKV